MKTPSIVIALYACILLIGGIIGFIKANSIASILISSMFAFSLFLCSFYNWKGKNSAYDSAIFLVFSLLIFFAYRFSMSYKLMPAGMMIVLSSALLVYLGTVRSSFKMNKKPLSKDII